MTNRKIASLILCLCLITLCQIPGIAHADTLVTEINEITIDSGGDDIMPNVCKYRNEIWLTWQSASEGITNGQDQDIVVKNFNGETWGDVKELSSSDNVGADTTPVSMVFNSNLYIAWATNDEIDSAGSDWDIVIRKHDGAGWGNAVEITDINDSGDDYRPQLCEFKGKLYIAWQSWDSSTSDGADADIVLKVFDNETWQPVAKPMIGDDGDDSSAQLQVFNDLMYLIWSTDDKAGNGADLDILSRSFDGTQWNPVVELTSTIDSGDDYHPCADVIGGKMYVLWQTVDDSISTGKDDDIVMREYDGEAWSEIQEITSSDILGHKDSESDSFPLLTSYQDSIITIWQTNDPVTSSGNDWDIVLGFHNGDKWSKITEITSTDDAGSDGGIYAAGTDAVVLDDKLYIIWQTKDTKTSTDGDWDLVITYTTLVSIDDGNGVDGDSDNYLMWAAVLVIVVLVSIISISLIKRKP